MCCIFDNIFVTIEAMLHKLGKKVKVAITFFYMLPSMISIATILFLDNNFVAI